MDISHYIKTLLSAHDCVIIPNFGAFIADYSPAVVSNDKSTIPGKDILFNRQLTRNDGLLINAFIEEQDLEYKDAKETIARYVTDMNAQLANGEKIHFEGVGTLTFDEAGFVQFAMDEDNSCLLDSYGLQPISLKKIKRSEASVAPVVTPEPSSTRRRVLMRVASVAAVVILIIVFAKPLTDKPVSDYASLGFDPSTPNVIADPSSVLEQKKEVGSEPVVVAPILPEEDIEQTSLPLSGKSTETKLVAPLPHQKNYHIIIASLANEQLAVNYVTTFKRKYDFENVETIYGSGRYRVSVAHFSRKKEAAAFVTSLRLLNPKFKDCWVLPQTLN